jgi:hypothetical protein
MTAKSELLKAHEMMTTVMNAKFGSAPEWVSFRAVERALLAELQREDGVTFVEPKRRERVYLDEQNDQPQSYNVLTDQALQERGKPIPTPLLMEFIGARRKLDPDADKAKTTVTSTLSKHPRYKSVPWEGGRAWWYADRPVPK